MIMTGTTVAGTTSESELANVRTPLQLTDRVFITVGGVTYKGTLANVLAYISANIDLSAYVTTASIVNVLTSTSTTVPVSAAQAKVLKDLIDTLTTAVGLKLDSSAASTTYATIANQRYSFNQQSGTTYTIALADVTANGQVIVELSNGSFTDCTVPTPTSLGVTAGDSVHVSITGAYAAQKLLAGSGATLTGNALFSFQYETKTLIAKDSTTWKVVGG